MHVAPKPDHVYRRTDSKALIGPEGFDADVCDLDIVRALECGDLVRVEESVVLDESADEASERAGDEGPAKKSSKASKAALEG